MKEEEFYRIGKVAELLEVNPSVLRFWETEFPQIAPDRTEKGQRVYSLEKIRLLRRIQNLLYDKGLTIQGAKRVLGTTKEIPEEEHNFIRTVTDDLLCARKLLEDPYF